MITKKSILACLFASLMACSTTTTTRTVTTEEEPRGRYHTTETTVNEVERDDGCGGVLSCTVDVVGEVIALPFRAVGALFRAIF